MIEGSGISKEGVFKSRGRTRSVTACERDLEVMGSGWGALKDIFRGGVMFSMV